MNTIVCWRTMQKFFIMIEQNNVDIDGKIVENFNFSNDFYVDHFNVTNVLKFLIENSNIINFIFNSIEFFLHSINCKIITNQIKYTLLLNQLQRLTIEKIFEHIVKYIEKFCESKKKQLLLYIKNQNDVEKIKWWKRCN